MTIAFVVQTEAARRGKRDGFYAQARRGQLVYGGEDFNMRPSN